MIFDPFVRYYDADYGSFEDDLVFYRELARMQGGAVLEAMCGTGRVAVPLAQAGLEVLGVDISPAMIAVAEAKGSKARFCVGDLRTLELEERFGMALVAVNSFMHLETTEDQLAALDGLYRHLEDDGLLVLDLFNPDVGQLTQADGSYVLDRTFRTAEGAFVQKFVARSVDLAAQHIAVTFCYDELDASGRVERTVLPFGMRWVYAYELEHLLARSGFVLEELYGSYDLEPYTSASDRLLAVARRS